MTVPFYSLHAVAGRLLEIRNVESNYLMKQPLRILIVEDDPLMLMTLEESLSGQGYVVCGKATDYEAAIRLMKTENPDLALLDIQLAGEADGVETAIDLLRIKPVPILYLTGNMDDEVFERAKKTNPAAFLYKPFRIRELARQVDLALLNYAKSEQQMVSSVSGYLYVPDGYDKIRIDMNKIIYIRADGNYCQFYLAKDEFRRLEPSKAYQHLMICASLAKVEVHLPENFYKLTRSLNINLDYLDRISTGRILLHGHEVDLPEGKRKALMDVLRVVGYSRK